MSNEKTATAHQQLLPLNTHPKRLISRCQTRISSPETSPELKEVFSILAALAWHISQPAGD